MYHRYEWQVRFINVHYTDKCEQVVGLTLSLPRVINFKFPPLPHQNYYVTQQEELFIAYTRWKTLILRALTTSLIHSCLRGWENVRFKLESRGFALWRYDRTLMYQTQQMHAGANVAGNHRWLWDSKYSRLVFFLPVNDEPNKNTDLSLVTWFRVLESNDKTCIVNAKEQCFSNAP